MIAAMKIARLEFFSTLRWDIARRVEARGYAAVSAALAPFRHDYYKRGVIG